MIYLLKNKNLDNNIIKIHFSNEYNTYKRNLLKKEIYSFSNFRDISLKILGEKEIKKLKKLPHKF